MRVGPTEEPVVLVLVLVNTVCLAVALLRRIPSSCPYRPDYGGVVVAVVGFDGLW